MVKHFFRQLNVPTATICRKSADEEEKEREERKKRFISLQGTFCSCRVYSCSNVFTYSRDGDEYTCRCIIVSSGRSSWGASQTNVMFTFALWCLLRSRLSLFVQPYYLYICFNFPLYLSAKEEHTSHIDCSFTMTRNARQREETARIARTKRERERKRKIMWCTVANIIDIKWPVSPV